MAPLLKRGPGASARLIAASAAIGSVFLLDADSMVWLMFAAGAATAAVYLLTRPNPVIALAAGPNLAAAPPHRRTMIAAWTLVSIVFLVGARVAVYGLGTGFL